MIEGLWYLCGVTGVMLIAGSLILISKKVIVLNDKTGDLHTEINLPFGIRLSTNLPVLIMLFLGVVLLVYPIKQANEREKILSDYKVSTISRTLRRINLKGHVEYPEPIKVFVIAAQQPDVLSEVSLEVPLSRCSYTVTYWCGNGTRKLGQEDVTLNGDESDIIMLKGFRGKPEMEDPLCNLSKPTRTEQNSVVGKFK